MSTKPIFEQICYETPEIPIRIRDINRVYPVPPLLNYHSDVEIQLITQGSGSCYINGRHYPFSRNTLLIIPPNAKHCFIPLPAKTIHKFLVNFSLRILSSTKALDNVLQDARLCLSLDDNLTAELLFLMRGILREIDHMAPEWKALVRLKVREIVLLMRRAQIQQGTKKKTADNPVITKLVAFLDQNYSQPKTVAFLSEMFGYSRWHLTRIFKRQIGVGLKHYILHRRIAEACKLLGEQPNLKTTAISESVGFHDYKLFIHYFKIMTGSTPSEYRTLFPSHSTKAHCQ